MKKSFLGFAAFIAVLLIALNVTAKDEPKSENPLVWFDFIGSPGEEEDPDRYIEKTVNMPECEPFHQYLCEILAPAVLGSSPRKPDLNNIEERLYKPTP